MKTFLFLALITTVQAAFARPNIVVLYADDWRFDTLSCAANPVVKTPNLDKLASRGVRFTENCVTTSVCVVSRATLVTGQWVSRHGHARSRPFETSWNETYPALLRKNGYWVGHVGKWHHGKFPAERFDFGRSYYGRHWIKQKGGKKIHVTQKNENDSLDFLAERPKDLPFCLTVAFFAPHAEDNHPKQFLPQPESMKLYKVDLIPVPENATGESWKRLPDFFDEKNEGRNRWQWRFDTPEKYQTMMKNYYSLATEVDATCGRIIEELKKQGVYENTLVIFTTDNGYYHGEHGLADKWYPHQESIRVPLIVDDPRMPEKARGTTDDNFTLNVDLAPTILKFAGIDVPKGMQGQDMSPLYLVEEKPEWRQEFFYEHPTVRNKGFIPASEALVRKDWKYFYWPDYDVEQLFHITGDPHEENDLAASEEHADILADMRERFAQLKQAAK